MQIFKDNQWNWLQNKKYIFYLFWLDMILTFQLGTRCSHSLSVCVFQWQTSAYSLCVFSNTDGSNAETEYSIVGQLFVLHCIPFLLLDWTYCISSHFQISYLLTVNSLLKRCPVWQVGTCWCDNLQQPFDQVKVCFCIIFGLSGVIILNQLKPATSINWA